MMARKAPIIAALQGLNGGAGRAWQTEEVLQHTSDIEP